MGSLLSVTGEGAETVSSGRDAATGDIGVALAFAIASTVQAMVPTEQNGVCEVLRAVKRGP